jgi:hypothetical protein
LAVSNKYVYRSKQFISEVFVRNYLEIKILFLFIYNTVKVQSKNASGKEDTGGQFFNQKIIYFLPEPPRGARGAKHYYF